MPSKPESKTSTSGKSKAASTLAKDSSSAAAKKQAAKTLGSAGGSAPRSTKGSASSSAKNSAKSSASSKAQPAKSKPAPAKQQQKPDGRGRVTAAASQQASQQQLNRYKMEAAKELGLSLDGSQKLSRQQAGQLGGRVVKKMVAAYERKK